MQSTTSTLGNMKLTNMTADRSPRAMARLAGLRYLLIAVCSGFSFGYVRTTIIVPGDATATVSKLMASEWLFRLGIVGDAVVFLSEIVLIAILYTLLKPVSKTLSLAAAFARLAMVVMQGMNLLNYCFVLLLLSGAGYLTVFEQISCMRSCCYFSMRMNM